MYNSHIKIVKDLEDVNFHDIGDLDLPLGNTYKSLELIKENVEQSYADKKKVFGIVMAGPLLKSWNL